MLPQNQATEVLALPRVDADRLGERGRAIQLCRSMVVAAIQRLEIGEGLNLGRDQHLLLHHPRRIRHRRSAGTPRQVIVTPQSDNRPLGRSRRSRRDLRLLRPRLYPHRRPRSSVKSSRGHEHDEMAPSIFFSHLDQR